MKKKICSRCKLPKNIPDDFCKCARMKDGFQPACKSCMNDSYTRSRNKKLKHYNEVKRLRREKCLAIFDAWAETQRCITCGESDPDFFDLHHLDPNQKDVNISSVKNSWVWNRLLIELNKCVVLCCKCHRKVHAGKLSLVDNSISIV